VLMEGSQKKYTFNVNKLRKTWHQRIVYSCIPLLKPLNGTQYFCYKERALSTLTMPLRTSRPSLFVVVWWLFIKLHFQGRTRWYDDSLTCYFISCIQNTYT
jgi:hypothetical protein